jgi:predicted methyltransferase
MAMRLLFLFMLGGVLITSCDRVDPTDPGGAQVVIAAPAGSLEWAVAGPWRAEQDRAVDVWRKPVLLLEHIGVQPEDQVLEFWPTGGYWTAILAPYLAKGGGRYHAVLEPAIEGEAAAAEDVGVLLQRQFETARFYRLSERANPVAAASMDHVLLFEDVAAMMAMDEVEGALREAARALKSGGTLTIVQARAATQTPQDLFARSGYVREDYVRELARNAGFTLLRQSDLFANPRDSRDHALGVRSLPPYLMGEDGSREGALEIGAPDRMILTFQKTTDPDVP